MCSGPTVRPQATTPTNSNMSLNPNVTISGGVRRPAGSAQANANYIERRQAALDPLRADVERSRAAGTDVLRGLGLPQVTATSVPDLKNLMGFLLPRRSG